MIMKNVFLLFGIILAIMSFNMVGGFIELFGKGLHPAFIVGNGLQVLLIIVAAIFLIKLGIKKPKQKNKNT